MGATCGVVDSVSVVAQALLRVAYLDRLRGGTDTGVVHLHFVDIDLRRAQREVSDVHKR